MSYIRLFYDETTLIEFNGSKLKMNPFFSLLTDTPRAPYKQNDTTFFPPSLFSFFLFSLGSQPSPTQSLAATLSLPLSSHRTSSHSCSPRAATAAAAGFHPTNSSHKLRLNPAVVPPASSRFLSSLHRQRSCCTTFAATSITTSSPLYFWFIEESS